MCNNPKTPPTTTPWPDQIPNVISIPISADSIRAIGFLLPTSRSARTLVMVYSCGPDVDSSYIDYKSINTDLTSENDILDANFFALVHVARFRFTHPI